MTVGVVPKGMKKLGKSIEQNTNKNAINCNRLEIKEKDEPAAINLEELEKSKEEKEEEDRYKKELFKFINGIAMSIHTHKKLRKNQFIHINK